jgi:DNA-binding response OmpR family regulator
MGIQMKRILIIDDDYQLRELLRKLFENEGYEVLDALDGNHGIQLNKEQPADLVITDLIMPEKDGMETIREFKRENPDMGIIAISGGGHLPPETYFRVTKKAGANYTFKKPFNPEELLNAVRDLLQ